MLKKERTISSNLNLLVSHLQSINISLKNSELILSSGYGLVNLGIRLKIRGDGCVLDILPKLPTAWPLMWNLTTFNNFYFLHL